MKKITDYNKIHFIGIFGSSMSNLALLSKSLGFEVSGSDKGESTLLSMLEENDILAYVGSNPDVAIKADLVVYTSAIPYSDPELYACKNSGIKCISRAEFLGEISMLFDKVIAVSGTHGKSTVTAMLGEIFSYSGKKPCVHLGGLYRNFENCRGEYFITEACEYKESFLSLSPDIAVILNIETDHPDYYKSMTDLYCAFERFANNSKPLASVVTQENLKINTFRKSYKVGRDSYALSLSEKEGFYSFTPYVLGKKYPRVSLNVRGEHNVTNALFALLVSAIEGIDAQDSTQGLERFYGVDKRYQTVGKINGAEIILDYAHHPTEIIAAISTAKLHAKHVTVYFQPHTYSRTEKLFSSFVTAFDDADEVIIVEEFPARETPDMGKSAKDLASALKLRKKCKYTTLKQAKNLLYSATSTDETVLLLGAGNIDSLLLLS